MKISFFVFFESCYLLFYYFKAQVFLEFGPSPYLSGRKVKKEKRPNLKNEIDDVPVPRSLFGEGCSRSVSCLPE